MRRQLVATLFAVTAATLGFTSANAAQSAAQILTNVNESARVTLAGNTRAEANAKNDRGAVSDAMLLDHMYLALNRPAAQETALNKLISDQINPKSANYHKWLTPTQFGAQYGVAQTDIDTITHWLTVHGFHVNEVMPSRMLIDFSGNAGQVRDAFQTEIHHLSVNGVSHVANMRDPSIPAALAPAVAGIFSLHDFRPHAYHVARPSSAHPNVTGTCDGFGPCLALVPADMNVIYNVNPTFNAGVTGKGVTIDILESGDPYNIADWTTFRSVLGLSGYTSGSVALTHPNCTDPTYAMNGSDVAFEAILDVEWVSAAAPNATVTMTTCEGTFVTDGVAIAAQQDLNAKTPPMIISMSYGFCETGTGAAANKVFYNAWQQAAAEGTTVFVSSGDSGAGGCDQFEQSNKNGIDISGWGDTPFNVSVGGTDFGDTFANCKSEPLPITLTELETCDGAYWNTTNTAAFGSAKSYIPEVPWNDSCAGGLITSFLNFTTSYGKTGLCNDHAQSGLVQVAGGSGGPSACATGSPTIHDVVSGTCKGYPKPAWQAVFGNPNDGVRDIPDVSLFASNGFWNHYWVVCNSDPAAATSGNPNGCSTGNPLNWSGGGGTSFASPIMAGFFALIEQKQGLQGNAAPTFYSLAATEYGASGNANCNSTLGASVAATCIFYDVTEGDNDMPCTGTYNCYLPSGVYGVISTSNTAYQPAYTTGKGWDFATGIGTVNVANLVNAWP